jgi:pyrroloquinoline quinone (PQQ) biosynthesis protein C
MNPLIRQAQNSLSNHLMYSKLETLDDLRIFMKFHVFAVWDFMSLLKSLQRKITCVSIPWRESTYDPALVQMINEIVLGEESDVDQYGRPCSHYSLYLKAMDEIGADTELINKFINNVELDLIPNSLKQIVGYHLGIAQNGSAHQVAASFFYGREKIIPEMFESILKILEENKLNCPTLMYYFKRHIEVDSSDHGPKAEKCLDTLLTTKIKKNEATETALKSLEMRNSLWCLILEQINDTYQPTILDSPKNLESSI